MEAIDTVYEYAGYQGALAIHVTLIGLGIPLLAALGGIAWRFMRVAEDGLARPLLMYLLSLVLIWWLLSPTELPTDGRATVSGPRFMAWLGAGSDAFTRRATRSLNERFLRRPFEWERLAAMCGLARVYTSETRENLHAFFEACTRPAIAALDHPPAPAAEENPLRDDAALSYERFTFTWRVGSRRGETQSCAGARGELLAQIGRDIETSPYHRTARAALDSYDANGQMGAQALDRLYLDQVVRNEWRGTAGGDGEMAAVRAAVGRYDLVGDAQNTFRPDVALLPDDVNRWMSRIGNAATSLYATGSQAMATATDAKQKYYLVTTVAPELYGLSIMLLIALFPIAGLWALLPGKWTALVHFSKLFVSVKLWPVGWAILSGFSARRPAVEAFSIPGQPDAHTGSVFIAGVMMYFLIPALAFVLVSIATGAAALPFRQAMPPAAGGNPGRDALAVAARVLR